MRDQARKKTRRWNRFARPLLAYFLVCFAIGLVLTFGLEDKYGTNLQTFIYSLSALWFGLVIFCYTLIPAILFMYVLRYSQISRGYADILAGALIGFLFPISITALDITVWIPLFSEWDVAIQHRLLLSTSMGASAGLSYWLLSGCPRTLNRGGR